MSSIELRNDTSGLIPHTFIVVTGPDGVPHNWGFYPATSGSANDAGLLRDDTGHPSTSTTGPMELSPAEYARLMAYIDQTRLAPPPYGLMFGSQCATWAINALVAADGGIRAADLPNMQADSFFKDVSESVLWNPWTLQIKIALTVNTATTAAANWTPPRDPLVLDLDGDGIEAVGINPANPILFDMDASGTKHATGWIKADDGIVVMDRDGNGQIDSGRELFGDQTILTRGPKAGQTAANGFEALADLDLNGDGALNSADAAYSQLRIWQDTNQNGISESTELRTLGELGIASINVAGTASSVNLGNGNTQPFTGSFTRTNGSSGTSGVAEVTGSLLLANNNFYWQFTDDPVVTTAAAALPQMTGSGLVICRVNSANDNTWEKIA